MGKKIVVCDTCKIKIDATPKELKYIKSSKVRIEGFICSNCNRKYIIVITDNKLRANIYRLQEKRRELEKNVKLQNKEYEAYTDLKQAVPLEVINKWEEKIVKLKKECDKLLKSNQEYEKQLRQEYKGEY